MEIRRFTNFTIHKKNKKNIDKIIAIIDSLWKIQQHLLIFVVKEKINTRYSFEFVQQSQSLHSL